MKPILEKKSNTKIRAVYIIVLIICVAVISMAVYLQFFTEEKIGIIFGITENDEEFSELESNFNSLFTNDLEILDETKVNNSKIEQKDIVYAKFRKELQNDVFTIDVDIPFINIDEDTPKKFNEEIQNAFKLKTESILKTTDEKVFYTVSYKAYIQNDILSLVIKSELKENESKQRIIVQTYNYNLKEKREATLEEILNLKSINMATAESKIKKAINLKQQNNKSLSDLGYNLYERDYTSSVYDINNAKQFLFGKDGRIYVIYAYGNEDFTSEMDLVIF